MVRLQPCISSNRRGDKKHLKQGRKVYLPEATGRFCEYTKNLDHFPDCSYLPGIRAASLKEVLSLFTADCNRVSLKQAKKMKGYLPMMLL